MIDATGASTTGLQFGLLGPLRVTRLGDALPLGGRQQRAVLAVLLVHADTVVSIGGLVDAVWGEQPPPGAVPTVQTYVSHLREVLEPGRPRGVPGRLLVTEQGGYRLRVAEAGPVDAAVFEARVRAGQALLHAGRFADAAAELAAALGGWRGPVLADLADYEFARVTATRLDELRLAALEARTEAELALGRHQQLVAELDQLIAEHPLRERPQALRMLALYRCGRQSDALAAYQQLRVTLAEELGIDPSPPLQELQRAILAQDPALNWQPAAVSASLSTVEPCGQGGADRPPGPAPVPGAAPAVAVGHRQRRRLLVAAVIVATVAVTAVVIVGFVVSGSSPRLLARLPANGVGSIDHNGGLRSAVPVGQSPDGLAYGAGSLWATNTGDGTVSRIDPHDHRVIQTTNVGAAPNAVTVTGNDVWVVNGGDGTVSRINALAPSRAVLTIPVGNLPDAIAAGPSGVWVVNGGDDTVQRIDAGSGRTGPPIPVGGQPDGVGVGARTVWVANGRDGTVSPVDAATGTVASPIFVGTGPKGVAVSPTAVWVTNALDLTVSRIDPETGRVTATVPVGDGPHSVVTGPGVVWVSDEYDGTLTKIDPATNRTVTIATGSSPRGLAMVGPTLWVASGAFASPAHRGGTLTIEADPLPGQNRDNAPGIPEIDPAAVYDSATFGTEHMVYDGLVELRHAGGGAGQALVPDLATTLPRPTDGGKTYTFSLRAGIRYSTGATVRPEDIRRGVQRALTIPGGNPSYYTGIVGGQHCADHPATCDLSQGVVVDDATSSISFHLTAPDPDFLYKLTVFVYATAPGAAATDSPTPLPATGPYMISGYSKGAKQFTLVRNPHFHQWSFAAQPDGYPDIIRWRLQKDQATQVADILAGRADLGGPELSAALAADLAHRYPAQLHFDPYQATGFEFLNTRIAPFKNIDVRRALNYAVDRRTIAALWGGASQVLVTCQPDPPNFPGYRRYCPYTLDPQPDGSYHGPDLHKAKALISASGTRGEPVAVWSFDGSSVHAISEYYVGLLRTLGYRATLHEVQHSCGCYFSGAGDSRNRAQIGFYAWGTDFPTPDGFYAPVLSCAAYRPNSEASNNFAEYCNPAADAIAAQAQDSETVDPAKARRLWAQLDRTVTDDAPWVAAFTPVQPTLTSSSLGNYQDNPLLGPLYDQMWIR